MLECNEAGMSRLHNGRRTIAQNAAAHTRWRIAAEKRRNDKETPKAMTAIRHVLIIHSNGRIIAAPFLLFR
jgi:hypothetical protein